MRMGRFPDLFITFTCNHKWTELVDFLKVHKLKPEDRPDLVSRIFKIKLNRLINDIKKGNIFGKVRAGIFNLFLLLKCLYNYFYLIVKISN